MVAPKLFLSVPHMGELEEQYVREAFATNWISTVGPNLTGFEADFREKVTGGLPCVALASGTAAMHLGLRLLGVEAGDDVLCSDLTFVASANAIAYLGARPVFVDSDRDSWNLDPALLEETLGARAKTGKLPRALVVVHLYGQSADLDPILATCARYGVRVLEDAAEAAGTHYKGRQVGTQAELSVFSFNGNKIITTSGGGMLVGRDEHSIEKARFWSQQARNPGVAYDHTELGYNYRLSNVLAGIGRGQVAVLEDRVHARRRIAFRYRDAFRDMAGLELMPQAPYGRHTNWLSVFLVDETLLGTRRDELLSALDRENIEARPVWKPMHMQPLYASCDHVRGDVAADLFRRGICLPSSSSMTEADQDRVIAVIRRTARVRPLDSSELGSFPAEAAPCAT